MAEVAKKHQDRLDELKKTIEKAHDAHKHNIDRFNEFYKFVFKTTMSDNEVATLSDRGMPTVEFNIVEAYLSRMRGEFIKQQPSLTVRAADGVPLTMLDAQFIDTMEVVEAHLKAVFLDSSNDMLNYKVFTDMAAGGFSAMKIYTDYASEMSFEQNIYIDRPYNVTMVIPDPMAVKSHKGDGRFIAEMYPMTRTECENTWGKAATKDMKFIKSNAGVNWSFKNETNEEVVLICEYFEKQPKREKIVRLSNGKTVTKKKYEEFLAAWEESGGIEQPPIILEERWTILDSIVRYRFCETKVLDYQETNYKYLPIVFFDGNGVTLNEAGAYMHMTRPYVYNTLGIQKLKNLAGQSLGNELENTIQHKFIVATESIPTDYQDAYQDVQHAQALIYDHFLDTNNPNITLPPPQLVARTPIPPEISGTFRMSDEMTQMILGSYDVSGSMANAPLSGIAFARSAMMSSSSSMPYIAGFTQGLNRVAEIYMDLIPKYFRTPRSMPVLLPDGKRKYVEINKKGSVYMNFDSNALQINVETGINFAMQKEIALQTIVQLSQSMPSFGQFISSEGLMTLLDNIDIRGIDGLKEKAMEYTQKQNQAAQQQQQMQAQQSQLQMAQIQKELQAPTETQIGQLLIEEKSRTDAANIAIKERDSQTKFIETMAKIGNDEIENELKAARIDAENTRSAVDSLIKMSDRAGAQNERAEELDR